MIAAASIGIACAQSSKRPATTGTSWQALQMQGDAAFDAGNYQEAVDAYDQAVTLARKTVRNASVVGAAFARMHNRKGDAYLELGRTRDAVTAFLEASRDDPSPALFDFQLCLAEYVDGVFAGALGACRKAIEYDPNYADAYFVMGLVLIAGARQADGKILGPPGTREALQGYLTLAPNGPHARRAQAMLANLR
jgi:tetratricopeptide (TPR) repeat protein